MRMGVVEPGDLTIQQVADYLRVSHDTVCGAIQSGQLDAKRVHGRGRGLPMRIPFPALCRYLAQRDDTETVAAPRIYTMEDLAVMLKYDLYDLRGIIRRDKIEKIEVTSRVWRMTEEQVEKFLAHLSKGSERVDDGLEADRDRVARQRARRSTTKTRGRTAA